MTVGSKDAALPAPRRDGASPSAHPLLPYSSTSSASSRYRPSVGGQAASTAMATTIRSENPAAGSAPGTVRPVGRSGGDAPHVYTTLGRECGRFVIVPTSCDGRSSAAPTEVARCAPRRRSILPRHGCDSDDAPLSHPESHRARRVAAQERPVPPMLDDLLDRLEGVRRSGAGRTARCPGPGNRRASLSVGRGDDGRWLLSATPAARSTPSSPRSASTRGSCSPRIAGSRRRTAASSQSTTTTACSRSSATRRRTSGSGGRTRGATTSATSTASRRGSTG